MGNVGVSGGVTLTKVGVLGGEAGGVRALRMRLAVSIRRCLVSESVELELGEAGTAAAARALFLAFRRWFSLRVRC